MVLRVPLRKPRLWSYPVGLLFGTPDCTVACCRSATTFQVKVVASDCRMSNSSLGRPHSPNGPALWTLRRRPDMEPELKTDASRATITQIVPGVGDHPALSEIINAANAPTLRSACSQPSLSAFGVATGVERL